MKTSVNKVLPNIFVGNWVSSYDKEFLRKKNITTIINCTRDIPFSKIKNIKYYRIALNDKKEESYVFEKNYKVICDFLLKKRNENILIHCHAGRQRSATVVLILIFFCSELKGDFQKCVDYIRSKRKEALFPHITFKNLSFFK